MSQQTIKTVVGEKDWDQLYEHAVGLQVKLDNINLASDSTRETYEQKFDQLRDQLYAANRRLRDATLNHWNGESAYQVKLLDWNVSTKPGHVVWAKSIVGVFDIKVKLGRPFRPSVARIPDPDPLVPMYHLFLNGNFVSHSLYSEIDIVKGLANQINMDFIHKDLTEVWKPVKQGTSQ